MKIRILCLLLLGVITLGICNAAPLNSDEQEARAFAERASSKIFAYYDQLGKDLFEGDESENATEQSASDRLWKTAENVIEIVNKSKEFDVSKFTDPELKYIFKIIRESARETILGEEAFIDMFKSMSSLEELSSDEDIEAFRNASVKLAFFPDIENVFAKSNDPEELKYYWTEWRVKNSGWAISHFLNLINHLKEAARLTDISLLEFWLTDYNVTEMERVMSQIQPLYLQLHGFIRNQLHKKYGDLVIKADGPIPHHLFEQVLAQAWTPGSVIENMYPHKDLPPYDEILLLNNYDTSKMYKMADRFYKSMGFTPIPDDYWGTHFIMSSEEDVGDCTPTILNMSPNVYMEYCQKMDFRKFLQAHGYMAEVYYAREMAGLPNYYFDSHNLDYPVGEAVVLSASTPKHLNAIGLVTEFRFTEEVKMNRLLRMGIHTLLNVPVYFVHTKVMADLFAGTIHITDLNRHYWKMMEKYVGVAPPVDRGNDAYDFPFKFYIELADNKQARKFMTEVLGYQFYERLCEISGQYSKTIPKSEPIHNCDFYGSKSAGDALKKMMSLGSSKPLPDVLATIFPEDPSVNAESLLEYYRPMKSWLIQKNREDNLIVGWKHSNIVVDKVMYYGDDDD